MNRHGLQRIALLGGASGLGIAQALGRSMQLEETREAERRQPMIASGDLGKSTTQPTVSTTKSQLSETPDLLQETAPEAGAPDPKPAMPDVIGWRENMARMDEAMAASPLETRQLKRMAAKALARAMAERQRIQQRIDRVQAHKRRRAGIIIDS